MHIRTNFYPTTRRFFDLFETGSGDSGNYFRVDIEEDDGEYRIQADLPGMRREDLTINVEENILTIEATLSRESDKSAATVLRRERFEGNMARKFMLPSDVKKDDIQAALKDGILQLTLPKATDKRQRKIAVA